MTVFGLTTFTYITVIMITAKQQPDHAFVVASDMCLGTDAKLIP